MHALALTGPRAHKKNLLPFQSVAQDSSVELKILEALDALTVSSTIASVRPELILIFGGDGTLNRHLGSLVVAAIPVLVVPLGSGNDFAKANGIQNISDAVQLWTSFILGNGAVWQTDLGVIAATAPDGSTLPPRYFSCCANIGLDSDAAHRTNALPNWLKANGGYILGALASIIRYQPQIISVSAGDRERGDTTTSEVAWFISISNTPTYGGGLKIAPQASITDGELDVTCVPRAPFSRMRLLQHFPKILSGTHLRLTGIKVFRAQSISIQTTAPLPVYADAEYVGQTPCHVSTAPESLSVLRFHRF